MTGTLLIVSAPSGAGKTSLVRALLSDAPWLAVSVSHTTRPPRPGEVDAVDYYFVNEARFKALVAAAEMLEYAHVFDHWYGTSKQAICDRLRVDKDVILEIDWQGARQVRDVFPDAVSVFILPPSRETLLTRLKARGQDSEATIARRYTKACGEMAHHVEYDYLIINDDFAEALAQLRAIAVAARVRASRQSQRHIDLLQELTTGVSELADDED